LGEVVVVSVLVDPFGVVCVEAGLVAVFPAHVVP
jgi:hypothetical protein